MKSPAFLPNSWVEALSVGLKLSAKEYRILSGSVRSEILLISSFFARKGHLLGWGRNHSREKPQWTVASGWVVTWRENTECRVKTQTPGNTAMANPKISVLGDEATGFLTAMWSCSQSPYQMMSPENREDTQATFLFHPVNTAKLNWLRPTRRLQMRHSQTRKRCLFPTEAKLIKRKCLRVALAILKHTIKNTLDSCH